MPTEFEAQHCRLRLQAQTPGIHSWNQSFVSFIDFNSILILLILQLLWLEHHKRHGDE